MNTVLPDTNVLIDLLGGDRSFERELSAAERILVTPVIAGEFLAGIGKSARDAVRRHAFESFLDDPVVEFAPHDRETGVYYASVHRFLRKAGTPIPQNDVWIAASALQHGATVLTRDAHFSAIPVLPSVVVPCTAPRK